MSYMAKLNSFEEMQIWQKSRQLAKQIFELSNSGNFAKDFRLRDQINGSAGSIMDNIAEGFERDGRKEFLQFLSIAKGSAGEIRSQLYRLRDRNYIDDKEFDSLKADTIEISKQISGLMAYLRRSDFKGTKYMEEPTEGYSQLTNLKSET